MKQLRDLHPGLAVALELPWAAPHRRLGEIDAIRLQAFGHLGGDRLTVPPGQLGLWIERIYVAHAAMHEQVDYGLGARRKVRRLGRERITGSAFQHPSE